MLKPHCTTRRARHVSMTWWERAAVRPRSPGITLQVREKYYGLHHAALRAHDTTVWQRGGHLRQAASRNLGMTATLTKRCQDPTSTRSACLKLDQHLRRWANIKPTLGRFLLCLNMLLSSLIMIRHLQLEWLRDSVPSSAELIESILSHCVSASRQHHSLWLVDDGESCIVI